MAAIAAALLLVAAVVVAIVAPPMPWGASRDVGAGSSPDPSAGGPSGEPTPGDRADEAETGDALPSGEPMDVAVVDGWDAGPGGTEPWQGHPDPTSEVADVEPTDAEETVDEPDAEAAATADGAPEQDDADAEPEDAATEARPALPSTQEVQTRLRELGYLLGTADGELGQQSRTAIMAYQQVHGLQVDGIVGPQTAGALAGPVVEPTLRGGPGDRIEVDLDRQLLHLVEGGERIVTLKVSSGSGATYRTASGGTAAGRTPVGEFTVLRRVHGVRVAPLGTLFDPLYFHGGFAIHGSDAVPPYPASHGCIRVARADAAWMIDRVPIGMPVHVYGGTHVFAP